MSSESVRIMWKVTFLPKGKYVVVPKMTGYTYGYNINCLNNLGSSKVLMNKQTNVYKVAEALPVLNNTEQLPKRCSEESIWESIPWYMEVAEQKDASIEH